MIAEAGLAASAVGVRALARLTAGVTMLLAIPATVVLVLVLQVPYPMGFIPLSLPVIGYMVVIAHPKSLARRAWARASEQVPEAVNYLAMSLAVRPSLERAVAFAAEHTDEAFGAHLRGVLWDLYLRAQTRVEDAFTACADRWGPRNEDLKRAMYVISESVREGSKEGTARALDRARLIVYEGARRRLEDYALGLRGPTSALFALGVLLPLIVGSMLPLLSLSAFTPTALEPMEPPPPNPVPWLLLLDVAFPGLTFLFGHHVSSKRAASENTGGAIRRGPLLFLVALPVPLVAAYGVSVPFAGILALGACVAILAIALHLASRDSTNEEGRIRTVERQFPDALFQLGGRLGEGGGLEQSFLAVAEGLQGTEAGDLFREIARSLRLGGGTVELSLFGPSGALQALRPRGARATLKMVVDLAAKDPKIAGRATVEMSGHLRDLQSVERDLRAGLRPTIDAMRATAMFFAPIVLGVTAALYALLSGAFAGVATLPMTPLMFQLALAVYLLGAAAAILYFAVRIEAGYDAPRFCAALARTLPVGYATFAATLFLASAVF